MTENVFLQYSIKKCVQSFSSCIEIHKITPCNSRLQNVPSSFNDNKHTDNVQGSVHHTMELQNWKQYMNKIVYTSKCLNSNNDHQFKHFPFLYLPIKEIC